MQLQRALTRGTRPALARALRRNRPCGRFPTCTTAQQQQQPSSAPSRNVAAAAASAVEAPSAAAPAPATPAGKPPKTAAVDGNEATARVAYAASDVCFIYPITPSTPMGEAADQWSTDGRRNVWGNIMQVTQMESEAGVAGALHGALAAGALATTFTCSQGLLLMIPNMYKISGELMPCAMHVSARALAGHALSIFGDHQDVMAVRSTGWALLSSHSVQEAHDLALVAHAATLRAGLPILHFFDGFRTSHEVNKINLIDEADIRALMDELAPCIAEHRARALNPAHPHQRGTAQGPDVYMQAIEAANPYHDKMAGIVQEAMDRVAAITGRHYRLFDYVGHLQAEDVVVAMGSGCEAVESAVEGLVAQGRKVGLVKVHLFRPWSAEHLLAALPQSVRRVAVLDRTKEHGSGGEPLLQDVAASLMRAKRPMDAIIGGRYGLGSKDFTPAMAIAVFENLASQRPKDNFTVGITDDVTFSSLPHGAEPEVLPEGTTECIFWGMGSDGTVGANKEAVKIIANKDGMHAQAYFSYDAHKSGGVTTSHLRFGPAPIRAPYLVQQAHYIGVHQSTYAAKYDIFANLRPGGVVLINAPWKSFVEVLDVLPARSKARLAELQPQLYCLDAGAVANEVGLGRRVNMVMQAAFFALSGVVDIDEAIPLLKDSIKKAYGKKGDKVVNMNYSAVDKAMERLVKIDIPAGWGREAIPARVGGAEALASHTGSHTPSLIPARVGGAEALASQTGSRTPQEFLERVVKPMLNMEGDRLPVSVFVPGGFFPPGTTAIEKRAIAAKVPAWASDSCTQCNICAFVCPHAAVRPALALPEELGSAPAGFQTVPVKGGGTALKGYQYRVQVSPMDCTGCDLCVHACPDNCLIPTPIDSLLATEEPNWDFFKTLPSRGHLFNKETVKGSQFSQPLMEFSGACEGCGETPYVKLLTQMFGTRMVIANSTGCSSIWGGSAPANPYCTDELGRGPAWANSLFEDTAQFGYGIALGLKQRRQALEAAAKVAVQEGAGSEQLRQALAEWAPVKDNGALARPAAEAVRQALAGCESLNGADTPGANALRYVQNNTDLLDKPSMWVIGGDGWAYDIGFAGVDHVLSTGEDVNILVLDTEEYSNTGGQKSKASPLGSLSKASPLGSVVKFATAGKDRPKKELGLMTMQGYPDVYVASICLGSNYNQTVKAFAEAEAHPGPSLILAYSPCAMHGMDMTTSNSDAKIAVDSGYWPLYRYQPGTGEGDGKLILDSKKIKGELEDFLNMENRFKVLKRSNPEEAEKLKNKLDRDIKLRHERLIEWAKPKAKPADEQ
ncbi:hypothetical protein N2152v2_008633 [Parachlorella kessleri]